MKRLLVFGLLTVLALSIASQAGKKVPVVESAYWALDASTPVEQVKGDLTVTLTLLDPSRAYDFPQLFSYDKDKLKQEGGWGKLSNAFMYFPSDKQGKNWCYVFGFQSPSPEKEALGVFYPTVAMVSVKNNTGHILRMSDYRIYMRVEGNDPVKAVTNLGNATLVPIDKDTYLPKSALDGDESVVHRVTYYEQQWEQKRKKGLISFPYPVGFVSQVLKQNQRNFRLINEFDREILPGDSSAGILFFPVTCTFPTAKIMFYDLVTKTDAAGNVTEKQTFEYRLNLANGKAWLDETTGRWVVGDPPAGSGK